MKFAIDKKVTLLEWGIILVLCSVFATFFIRYQTKVLNIELDERASVLLNNLALNMEYPILVRDRDAISRLAKGVMAQKDVIFCRVEDKAGTTLFQEGSKDGPCRMFSFHVATKKVPEAEESLILNIPEAKKEGIGKLYLAASLSGLNQKIADMKKAIIELAIGAIIFASLVTYILLKKIIGRPILRLVDATEKIAAGDLAHKVSITSRDEFGVLAGSFNKMTASLMEAQEELVRQEKLSILGQLAGSVGHELRNPLGVMSNAVYFLKTVLADSNETVREYLNIIKSEIDNSELIISDLLDFSRTKAPRTESIAVSELIRQSLDKCAIPGNVMVEAAVAAGVSYVIVDPFQMTQVFQNLIMNAVQAMREGGSLRVGARLMSDAGDFIEIYVSDTGEGVSPENMKKLFQPLFTTKAKGIGLGLTVCKRLAEANGGEIEVDSKLGKGTTFTVTLPVKGG